MIKFAAAHNSNVIVVIYSGGGFDMTAWKDDVKAIIMGWYPGQEGGLALARMLAGEFSPSGRLPMSIEASWEDNPVHDSYYTKEKAENKRGFTNRYVTYNEGVFMGYRGYDRSGIAPRYPFGYGLSYTSFEYSDMNVEKLSADSVKVSFTVANTGRVGASEIAQVYVNDKISSVARPVKELKDYGKVYIPAGKSVRMTFVLGPDAFSFYDVKSRSFIIEPGEFEILAGPSSAELPLRAEVMMGAPGYEVVNIAPDTVSVIKNPLNGWVMYMGRNWDADFGKVFSVRLLRDSLYPHQLGFHGTGGRKIFLE